MNTLKLARTGIEQSSRHPQGETSEEEENIKDTFDIVLIRDSLPL